MGLAGAINPIPRIPQNAWEWIWAPYDRETYTAVLDWITPEDIVLDIGAGDLRLSRRLAGQARRVYALERQAKIAQRQADNLPENCQLFIADARQYPFPEDITTAVLLMRHCTNFALYWHKLTAVSCRTLITNARWGLDVEAIDLLAERCSFSSLSMGWYACCCGHTGFLPGPADQLLPPIMDTVHEVRDCPACKHDSERFYHAN